MGSTFSGKTVLLSGASRGIGLATARRFASLGAQVGLVASSAERLAAAASEVEGKHHVVAADLTQPAECSRAVEEVSAALGPIDRSEERRVGKECRPLASPDP